MRAQTQNSSETVDFPWLERVQQKQEHESFALPHVMPNPQRLTLSSVSCNLAVTGIKRSKNYSELFFLICSLVRPSSELLPYASLICPKKNAANGVDILEVLIVEGVGGQSEEEFL